MTGTVYEFKVEYPTRTKGLPKNVFFSTHFVDIESIEDFLRQRKLDLKSLHKSRYPKAVKAADIWIMQDQTGTIPIRAPITYVKLPFTTSIGYILTLPKLTRKFNR